MPISNSVVKSLGRSGPEVQKMQEPEISKMQSPKVQKRQRPEIQKMQTLVLD